jgi:hypothetical protein
MKQVIRYLHAAAGFPTKDTWIKAITNGNYVTWPGLTVEHGQETLPRFSGNTEGSFEKATTKCQVDQEENW